MHERASAPCPGPRGRGLLERAVGFALASVRAVTPAMMPRRTPCASWNLEMLLLHLDDSLTALYEGAASGRVALERPPPAGDGEPVSSVRLSAVRLLRATGAPARVGVGDRGLGRDLMAAAGAVEVAAHGWDVAQASGERRPVPAGLADDLLRVCPLVLPEPRGALFAGPVDVAPDAPAGERLVALLGRRPL